MIFILWPLVFTLVATTLSLALCLVVGQLTLSISIVSLVISLFASFALCRRERFAALLPKTKKLKKWEWLIIFFYGLFCYRHFFWLVFSKGDTVAVLDVNNFGDLPLHMAYVNYLANGVHFWPQNPNLVNEFFTYPFGVDLFSALFVKIGVSILSLLPLMGLFFAVLLGCTLMLWGRGFALGAFLFAGGGAGYVFFFTGVLKDYQQDLAWKNLMTSMVLTQRGLLFALPAGLLLLWSWRRRFFLKLQGLSPELEGLFWGTMPFFHIHTFLFLSFIFAYWVLGTKEFKVGLRIFLWAVLPATLEVIAVTHYFHQASVIRWQPGWMIGHSNIFFFFWNNYGLFVPLTLIAAWNLKRNKPQRLQFLPALLLYVVCLFVMFAPWDWDNTKLMIWSYILILPSLYDFVLKRLPKGPQLFSLALLFCSGFIGDVSSYEAQNTGYEIYRRENLDRTCSALKGAPPEARVATAQIHNHPAYLCGHPLVAGYNGTLWSQGSQSHEIEDKLRQLMMGAENWRALAQDLKVRYIFWGPAEESQYRPSTRPWETGTVKIADSAFGKIYDLGENP